jgi:Amt family ammonium transporter
LPRWQLQFTCESHLHLSEKKLTRLLIFHLCCWALACFGSVGLVLMEAVLSVRAPWPHRHLLPPTQPLRLPVLVDVVRGKKPSALSFCIGSVVGLVAITPASGFVTVPSSLFIGTIASLISNLVVHWTSKTSLEDTLDVFPCHGVGGAVGMLMTGLLAHTAVNGANTTGNGLLFGEFALFKAHLIGLVVAIAFTFVGALVILKITDLLSPLTVSDEEKRIGSDMNQHGEKMHSLDLSARHEAE